MLSGGRTVKLEGRAPDDCSGVIWFSMDGREGHSEIDNVGGCERGTDHMTGNDAVDDSDGGTGVQRGGGEGGQGLESRESGADPAELLFFVDNWCPAADASADEAGDGAAIPITLNSEMSRRASFRWRKRIAPPLCPAQYLRSNSVDENTVIDTLRYADRSWKQRAVLGQTVTHCPPEPTPRKSGRDSSLVAGFRRSSLMTCARTEKEQVEGESSVTRSARAKALTMDSMRPPNDFLK